jgi:hypothetical protein
MHPHDTIAREQHEAVFIGPRLSTPNDLARFHATQVGRDIRETEAAVRTLLDLPPRVRAELPTMNLYHVLAQLQEAREEWEELVAGLEVNPFELAESPEDFDDPA